MKLIAVNHLQFLEKMCDGYSAVIRRYATITEQYKETLEKSLDLAANYKRVFRVALCNNKPSHFVISFQMISFQYDVTK